MNSAGRPQAARPDRSIFPPIALLAVVVVGLLASDVYHGYQRYAVLAERDMQLDKSVADSRRVREQFDALVTGVSDLANAGNSNASAIIASLKQAGVTVRSAPRP